MQHTLDPSTLGTIENGWVYDLLLQLGLTPTQADHWDRWVMAALVLLIAYVADWLCRELMMRVVKKIIAHTKATWDDILFEDRVLRRMCHVIPPILLFWMLPWAVPRDSVWGLLLYKIVLVYIVAVSLRFIHAFLRSFFEMASEKESLQGKPLKGLMQTGQVIATLIAVILWISILFDKSPARLLTGLGASAAILMLVFKDSIMGLVSGIQLSLNNMLHVGDWIAMAKYGVDGRVMEVTLNTVKVRNWDNTIVTIPPYLLVSDSFQNWRGMQDSGGRRIMRAIHIDMNSVHFCTPELMEQLGNLSLLHDAFIADTESSPTGEISGQRLHDLLGPITGDTPTNLGVFRLYMERYLRSLSVVNREMTLMVRYRPATETGLPVELYFFSSITEWMRYERIQADVFDHLLAILPQFELKVFQNPTGADFQALAARYSATASHPQA
ncbi:MAG: mechanosensitive ion channel [Alistipes sp.]|nr:mechanosensitive ion channel [Alistipes sp.]